MYYFLLDDKLIMKKTRASTSALTPQPAIIFIPVALGFLLVPGYLLLDFLLCCGRVQLQIRWKMASLLFPLLHVVLLRRLCHWKCSVVVGVPTIPQVA